MALIELALVLLAAVAVGGAAVKWTPLPLPWLIRRLDLAADPFEAEEHRLAKIDTARAGARAIEQALPSLAEPENVLFGTQLLREYAARIELHSGTPARVQIRAARASVRRNLRLAAIQAERERLRALRDANRINDETLREIEQELDERESLAGSATGRL